MKNKKLIVALLLMLLSTIGMFINVFFIFPLFASFIMMQYAGQKGGKQ